MAKNSEKKGKGSKKEEKSKKLIPREPSRSHSPDKLRSFDQELEEFRRNIDRALWWPRTRIGSTLLNWPDFYLPKLDWAETRQPLIDIKDTGKELVIEAEMPGIPKENIDIQLTENSIEICGEMKSVEEEEEGYFHQERRFTTCYRNMPLPTEVIPNMADATLEDGILYITLPKKKPISKEKTHSVKVK
ncbi:MAG: Hsp20/alpha crystallin family protein [Thermoplasmata archaeon]|nr:MAG: Hsp20/alpha crystallin family protein [Thermoplasmata archaeon]